MTFWTLVGAIVAAAAILLVVAVLGPLALGAFLNSIKGLWLD